MKSKDYWENRQAQRMWEYMQGAEETANEVASLYAEASEYLNKELDKIYQKYRSKHGLSQTDADRLLHQLPDDATMQQMMDALRQSQDDAEKAALLAELESPAYRARLERLEAVQKELDGLMQNVYQQEKTVTTRSYVDLANEAFTKTIYDVQQRVGLGFSFAKLDPDQVDKLLHSKWSGSNYSKRIWQNTQQVAGQLKHELLLNTLTGRTEREAAESLRQRFAVGASEARRLVRTESNYVSNQMQMQAYEECGIERYEYVATLDLRTSPRCRKLDGKRFPISEQQPGTNCPPMHPWCRSTTVCDLSEDERAGMERRARNPETGETELVPADMTYDDWYKKNVEGHPVAEANEKKIQNKATDRKQYEEYQKILGNDMPKTLEEFQKMKYTGGEEWSHLKETWLEQLSQKDFESMGDLVGKLENKETRVWYKVHDENIPNKIDRSKSVEEQAKQACDMRNTYRIQARELMKDKEERARLDREFPNKSFEQLIESKMRRKGMTREEAIKDIYNTATKTNKEVNQSLGLE